MKRLLKIWNEKWRILEGIKNSVYHKPYVEKIAAKRLEICKTNLCGNYNEAGDKDICYVKGKPCCGICGCKLGYLTRSLSSSCSLKLQQKYPLWDKEMTEEEEKKFREKTGLKNE